MQSNGIIYRASRQLQTKRDKNPAWEPLYEAPDQRGSGTLRSCKIIWKKYYTYVSIMNTTRASSAARRTVYHLKCQYNWCDSSTGADFSFFSSGYKSLASLSLRMPFAPSSPLSYPSLLRSGPSNPSGKSGKRCKLPQQGSGLPAENGFCVFSLKGLLLSVKEIL